MTPPADDRPVPALPGTPSLGRLSELPALQLLIALALVLLGLAAGSTALTLAAALLTLLLALRQLLPPLWRRLGERLEDPALAQTLAAAALPLALLAASLVLGWWEPLAAIYRSGDWQAIGAVGEGIIGAFGQVLIAVVALVIAWRQFVVDQRLTTQQNRITQAQTIDNFIEGISTLISDEEGLLEDWPLERMLAEGRMAAVLGSVDSQGKAKILRFLSHARLLTPLRRDLRLGRAILDGQGSYEEDRRDGVPVVRLKGVLRGADLSGADLRGIDFNGADLRGTIFRGADLSEANLAGCLLSGADLDGARLDRTRFFLGSAELATPADPDQPPDHGTGAGTGAVVENANLSDLIQLGPEARFYLASWSGQRSRQTLPGGCKGIANRLDR
jgi:uncharacterized protein YjbI with pentapeptide repeats